VATRQVYQNSIFSDSEGGDTVTHRAAASAAFPVYETNSITVGYDYLHSKTEGGSDDDTNVFDRNDGDSKVKGHQITLSGTRQLTSQASVGLTGSYAFRSFKDDNDDIDYQVWTAAFFTNYVIPGRLTLRGSVGLTGLTSDNGDNLGPGFFSFTSLAYQFGRAVATVILDRGFSETFVDGQDFGVVKTEGVAGSLSYAFTPTVTGGVGAYYRRSKSTGIGNNANSSTDDEKSKTWGGSAGLTWRILRNLTVELNYSYQKHSTDAQNGDDNNDYTENRARLAINVSF
jgi:hypothetical protein